ncbi:MAG: small subunit ribosomal protein S16 [Pirellulaceae bacterium]
MAVRIRLKKLGRRHRPFFRVCAMDARSPRDGRVIEELGYYDPMCKETDARAVLKKERIDYWLSVGAQPSGNVSTLIKKYGTEGTHLNQQAAAFERLKIKPQAPPPEAVPAPVVEAPAEPEATEAPADDAPAAEAPAEETPEASAETTEESSE